MIKEHLLQNYKIDRLYNSYLIQSDNVDQALLEVYSFLQNTIFPGDDNVLQHPDLRLVKREEVSSKNISVEQIRTLQEFIYKTSVISSYKIGIIVAADQMNVNAANSCLKMLEDTPGHGLIFLLTDNAAAILPTIRSRCSKINYNYNKSADLYVNESYLCLLNKKTQFEEKLEFLKEFAVKDRQKWLDFATNAEKLLAKFIKVSAGVELGLSEAEESIYRQLKSNSHAYLDYKLDHLNKLIKQTVEFDLDLRASSLLLIEQFRK